ncbi:PHD-zinc-finger like domain-containing protein [Blakeslea trispora]|nr:PHD-zinc-finger like domain-containing protein [Blakeslea trispora]
MLIGDTKHRRGRPRKQPVSPIAAEKPREERPFTDFYPDLDIREPLTIVKATPFSLTSLTEENLAEESKETESIKKHLKLPQPSFRLVSSPSRGKFELPQHYIRYTEPTESDLFQTVEYDMDEQDEVWLQIYNKERKKDNLGEISSELFEAMMDRIEKEWFNLVKNLPKKTAEEPVLPEDSKCAVCDDGECENSNAIVFCDGCNLAVHQDCYGIPYIPEGQWLCRKCMISPENPVSCLFCPNEGGALKQTTTNQWGHLLCAVWIPEVSLSNSVYMEPIDNIESIPKSRWKLQCYICKRRQGACIQCDNKHCFVAFHVTCARWARLCMRMKLHGTHYDGVLLKAYCDRHTPRDYYHSTHLEQAQRWFLKHKHDMPRKRYVDEEEIEEDRKEEEDIRKKKKKLIKKKNNAQVLPASYKAARAHQHQYNTATGTPIAPEHILNTLEKLPCIQKETKIKKKVSVITTVCRYWSLKRESRRGAPLLKRLHLEPWTASASQLKQSEVEKAQRASTLMTLRGDLEKVRMLSEQVQKRERQKLERIRKQKAYLEMIFYPIQCILQPVLDQLIELDKKELFRYPVTKEIAPDYHDIIQQPMSFSDIIQKLNDHAYVSLDEFEYDLSLIWRNSMIYNKSDTAYFKLAQKLEKVMQELMSHARTSYEQLNPVFGLLDVEIDPNIFSYGSTPHIPPSSLSDDNSEEDESKIMPTSDSTLSSSSPLSLTPPEKRKMDVDDPVPQKKRRLSSPESPKKRVTRSVTEGQKRSLRPRALREPTAPPKVQSSQTQSTQSLELSQPLQSPQSSPSSQTSQPSPSSQPSQSTQPPIIKRRSTRPKRTSLHYVDGEIVWAHVRGFPPHPAEIVEPEKTKRSIPDRVMKLQSNFPDKILVAFYLVSEAHTW